MKQHQEKPTAATRRQWGQPNGQPNQEQQRTEGVGKPDQLVQVSCRLGDSSCARAHASTLNRATGSRPSHSAHSLLRLQRQYGNQFVQRVVGLAGKSEGHREGGNELEQTIRQARGGGRALDSGVRAQMESALGTDFSGVRIHTDARADSLNRELSARAFTFGRDIFFRRGEYAPDIPRGRKLLSHELVHVVQQSGSTTVSTFTIGEPGDLYEQQADQVAEAISRSAGPSGQRGGGGSPGFQGASLHRQCSECDEGLERMPAPGETPEAPGAAEAGRGGVQNAAVPGRQGSLFVYHLASPRVQGAWSLDGSTDFTGGSQATSGNGDATHRFLTNGVFVNAEAWQSKERFEWCVRGGTASVSRWKATQYTFRHDGRDNDFLELTATGELSGGAKAEDLHYAKSGAAVVGLIKVRTPAAPTPTPVRIFTIKEGGKSAANVGSIADIEISIPIDGTITIRIPLRGTSEGALADFDEALTPPASHDVGGTTGSETFVDLFLAARVEATADIERTCVPESFTETNWGHATGRYQLVRWRDRVAPTTVTPTETAVPPGGGEGAATAGGRHQVRFQLQAGRRELIPSTVITRDRPITVTEGVTGVDNLWERAQRRHRNACVGARDQMQGTIRGYPPTGVACPPQCGHISDKMCNRDVTEDGYRLRIDFNNDAGHNFQS